MYKKQVPESRLENYFTVESISDFLLKIEKLDGKVIQPKQEVLEIGWIATAEDLEGNLFGTYSANPSLTYCSSCLRCFLACFSVEI